MKKLTLFLCLIVLPLFAATWYAQNSSVNINSVSEWNSIAGGGGSVLTWGSLGATDQGTIKADTIDVSGFNLLSASYDAFEVSVTKIYNSGTDAGLQNGCITVFGWGM